jgi:DNA repair protein RecO
MEQKRDLAIVLKSIAFEERSKIVTALTEQHGLITALARNAIQSRRFGGTLDVFCAGEWLFVEKPSSELYRLDEAHMRRSYEGLRTDFNRLALASVFNELMMKVAPKHEAAPELFRLHGNALAVVEEAKEAELGLPLLNAYMAKILQWSGSQPPLNSCLECEVSLDQIPRDQHVTCVIADAGWVCAQCRGTSSRHVQDRQGQKFGHSAIRVSTDAIFDFHMSLKLPIRQVPAAAMASKDEHHELFKFLEALFVYHLPAFDQQPLKSLRFLELESSPRPHATIHP